MRIPGNANAQPDKKTNPKDAYIINPHFGKEFVTPFEALDIINQLSAMLIADLRYSGGPIDHRSK